MPPRAPPSGASAGRIAQRARARKGKNGASARQGRARPWRMVAGFFRPRMEESRTQAPPLGMVAGFFRPRGLAGGLRLPGLRPLGSRRPHAGPIGGDDQIDCVPPRGSRAPRDRRAGPSPCAPAVSAQSVRAGGLRSAKPRRLPEAGTEPAPAGPPRLRAVFRARRGGFGSRSGRLPPSRPQSGWRPRGRKPGGAAARSAGRPARQGPGKASPSRSQQRPIRQKKGAAPHGAAPLQACRLPYFS